MTSQRLRFCPFCPVAPGEDPAEVAPSSIVARWSEAVAFHPRRRRIRGHVIVAPHTHVESGHRDPLVTAYTVACAASWPDASATATTT